MIKIIIIEDEIPARKKLKRFIEELGSPTEIIAELDTVQSAIEFLNQHQPDVIFSDIELLDGNAFEIYEQVSVTCPIIFTTAYDRFWMDAFDGNGIAYLLKPFSKERFNKAWDKFRLLKHSASEEQNALVNLTQLIQKSFSDKSYKKRFMINTHQGIYFLYTETILFFEANEGVVFAHDYQGNKHLLSEPTLKEIEEQLNPLDFYRINRGELIHKLYIEKIERYQKNTLAIKLKDYQTLLKTSQSQTAAFREWVEK
jgi:DNA-binding LytR/AlgR family response regulator